MSSNHGKKWVESEKERVKSLFLSGKTPDEIALIIGRTAGSVLSKIQELCPFTETTPWTVEDREALHRDLLGIAEKYSRSIESVVHHISSLKYLYATSSQPQTTPVSDPAPAPTIDLAPEPVQSHVSAPLAAMNDEQQRAFDMFLSGKSFFLTGSAGTGKSHIIKHIVQYCTENNVKFAVTAMTGVAASLISGQTMHKWTGLGLLDGSVESLTAKVFSKGASLMDRWRTTEVLIIDEVSMMNQELFEKLNSIAQKVCENRDFFGGMQVILCGDFAQLAPIQGAYAFESPHWIENTIYLKEVLRQDDPTFVKLLSEIRMGIVTPFARTELKKRLISDISQAGCENGMILPSQLYPHRKSVEHINTDELAKLFSPKHSFIAKDTKYSFATKITGSATLKEMEGIEERCPKEVTLCIGAQVMLTVNLDGSSGLVNGSRGVVMEFDGSPRVLFDNGKQLKISAKKFETRTGSAILTRCQIPLVLAWATTIHKCQGSTLTSVVTDLRDAFCDSQTYVTLSRVKSLQGLWLLGLDFSRVKCNPKVIEYYSLLDQGKQYPKSLPETVEPDWSELQ